MHLVGDGLSVQQNILPRIASGSNEVFLLSRWGILGVGLSHRMRHLPNEMSGGEQQRVAIARALVHDPSFVLADEPTGNVDSRTTASLMELLTDLNDEGTTVILITHDREVAEMSTRQVTLNDGRIEADSGALFGDAHG